MVPIPSLGTGNPFDNSANQPIMQLKTLEVDYTRWQQWRAWVNMPKELSRQQVKAILGTHKYVS